jgi:hypothetical protein
VPPQTGVETCLRASENSAPCHITRVLSRLYMC